MCTAAQRERSLEEHPLVPDSVACAVEMHFQDLEVNERTANSSKLTGSGHQFYPLWVELRSKKWVNNEQPITLCPRPFKFSKWAGSAVV